MNINKIEPTSPLLTRWSSENMADQFEVHDPATGELLAIVQGAGPDEVDRAVRTAHAAHYDWHARSPRERGRYLLRVADAVREHAEEIAVLTTSDNGKPIAQARTDVMVAVENLTMYSGLCEAMPGGVRDQGDMIDITILEPFGVVAGIVPFNWPAIHAVARPLAPALAVGNAVVIKPPEQAPLSVLRTVEVMASVLPDDIVHAVPGLGATGAELAGHPLVGKVSFTGAPTTGVSVLKTTAKNLTPTVMELGGKNPLVIFEDADVESALRWALDGGYFNAGQACTAASRVLVHSTLYQEVARRYAATVGRLRVGPGLDPATDVGPVVTATHRDRVLEYIDIGACEGATIAAQAPLPDDPALTRGYYVPPTLFTGVTPEMTIAREEIFGPVVCLMSFDDEAESIALANGTEFGLVAAVFTRDSQRQIRVARAIHAGVVFINNYNRSFVGTPFGGGATRHSGFGRENSHLTLAEYGVTKSLRLPTGVGHMSPWTPARDGSVEDSAET